MSPRPRTSWHAERSRVASFRPVLRRLPLPSAGRDALVRLEVIWWNRVRAPLRLRRVRAFNVLKGVRNSLARTAPNVARRNSRRAYGRLFGDAELLREYLSVERLRFYDAVVERCFSLIDPPRTVIDVGCGSGELLARVAARAPLARLVGLDFASSAIERGKERVPGATFVVGDLYRAPLQDTFDLVLCTEVLEHLARPDDAVAALVRLCNASGRIVITVPDGAHDTWEGHVNFWTEIELRSFLERFGDATIEHVAGDASLLAVVRPRPTTPA